MDLISRAKLVDLAKSERKTCGKDYDFDGLLSDIENAPTVPTVPLDKLCELLAEHYEPLYSMADIYKLKMPIDFNQQKEIWRAAIIRWMEEQDEAD